MAETRAQRTLVKSPPELWAEVSDLQALARHLGEFGEIRITRLEPETAVAWEGDRVRGTVQLEPSGWGTKVTLTADVPDGGDASDRAAAIPPEAEASPPEGDRAAAAAAAAAAAGAAEAEAEPEPAVVEPEPAVAGDRRASLLGRLLGRFRRRPATPADDAEPVAAERRAAREAEPAARVEDAVATPAPAAEPVAAERRAAREAEPAARAEDAVAAPAPVAAPVAEPAEPAAAEPAVVASPALDAGRAEAILTEVLDDLGSARHRPFSRLG